MKTVKHFIMLALAGLTFAACSNDDNVYDGIGSENPNANAPDAFTAFAINIPNVPKTRALTRATDPGTTEENAVKTLHVFIYDADPPHTPTVADFSVADGSLEQKAGSNSVWVTKKAIKTKKTDKYIFAGINLSPAIVSEIQNRGYGVFNYREFAQTVADVTSGINGFVMFNARYPDKTLSGELYSTEAEAQAAGAHLNIPVDRVITKASVAKGQNFVVNGGGSMSDLNYGWRNINKSFYFVQKVENNQIRDYNWTSYSTNDFTRGNDALTVNEYGSPISEFSYAMENAFDFVPDVTSVDEATFLSISGLFRPDKVVRIRPQSGSNPIGSSDFETIDNPNASATTFYTVRTDDGIINYFADPSAAEAFARLCNEGAEGMPALTGQYDINQNTYSDGRCYYHLFVNGEASAPQSPYNVYRNQYYKVTLNSMQAPGNPDDNFDDGKTIQPNAWIGVDIEVNEWELIEESHDL